MAFQDETQAASNASDANNTQPSLENEIAKYAYGFFCEILKIPHESGHEKALSDYLMTFAEKHGLYAGRDKHLNVFIRKPGSKGREKEPHVILQTHMDMVCEKNEAVKHNFLTDPIAITVKDDWVKAAGTTLGADAAGGLSLIMAVLALNNISHPPIEALITTEEETTMGGAYGFDTSLLSGKRFINLDSETEGVLTVSSASASDIYISIPVDYQMVPTGFAAYKMMVSGLTGGHSGIDINKSHANANVLAARLLSRLEKVRLASIDGGSKKNAIPRECTAIIFLDESGFPQIKNVVNQMEMDLKAEYQIDVNLTITLEKTESPKRVMNFDSQQMVISGILLAPNGVQSMSPHIAGLVQTSNNIGVVKTVDETVMLTAFFRSADIAGWDHGIKKMKRLMEALGAKVEISDQTPPWEYNENSPLRDTMTAVFKEYYGKDPQIAAVHAGLECAVFAQSIQKCDFISIGMDIVGAHSPDEKMSISSFDRTAGYLARVLEKL